MKHTFICGITVVIVLTLLVGCSKSISSVQTPSTPSTPAAATPPPGSEPSVGPHTYQVKIANFAFSPQSMAVNKGDVIVWTNEDTAPHTVTSQTGSELGSPTLSKGQTFSHTFTASGAFDYYCTIHPMMKGQVVVN